MSDFDRQKWNTKYSAGNDIPLSPSAVLTGLRRFLPQTGRALDIAAGAGRHGIWLAQQGLDVTLADVSVVGLGLARERAAVAGVTVRTVEVDLQDDAVGRETLGHWNVVVSVCFLHRPLFPWLVERLLPHGVLMVVQPTTTNLERHDRPPRGFLLEPGELPSLVQGLEILHYEEGWLADGRHDAVVVARRRSPNDAPN